MPFLTKADLESHLYAEVINSITRENDDLVTRAIANAVSEAKSYLSRFDLTILFGEEDPGFDREHLKSLIADIACWHLVKLSNPNVNLELFRTMYQDALKFLDKIMKGQADPDGWPYKTDNPDTDVDESSGVQWNSNRKRKQHF